VDPRTRWGFHQLTEHWARRLVDDARLRRGDLVLDIGAGHGALTMPLVATGARVLAFELHPQRVRLLRERFAGDNVKVVQADASDLWLPRGPFHVVANLPFALTSSIIRRLTSRGSALETAHLVVPHHAAMRWAGRVGRFDAWTAHRLPRDAFHPVAPGPTAVLRINGVRSVRRA